MSLKQIREYRKMDRRMLESQTSIKFRSIQDYEQGHKKLDHASYDTLHKLSLALACPENLLVGDLFTEDLMKPIDALSCYSEEYNTWGSIRFYGSLCSVEYIYDGKEFSESFKAKLDEKMLPFQRIAAKMIMEDGLEEYCFKRAIKEAGSE